MRTCAACGTSNGPGDDFCGNCGAYLGWSDTVPPPGARSGSAAFPDPDSEEPVSQDPVSRESVSQESAAPDAAPPVSNAQPGPGSSSQDRTPPGATPAPASPPANDPTPAHAEPHTPAHDSATRAEDPPLPDEASPTTAPAPSEPPPVAASETGARSPQTPAAPSPTPATQPPGIPEVPKQDPVPPVRPAKPVASRPVIRPAAVPEEVSGTPCPACAIPNPPDRRFCRRCAASLKPAATPAALPWWRTVWPLRRRVRASSGRAVRLLVILAVVVALCAGGYLLLPAGRALVEDTRDKLGTPEPVTPVEVEASAEVPGHPVTNTTDGLSNRYWGAPAPDAWVTYTFRKPFRMVNLIITNGASKSPKDYASQARALQLTLEVTTQDGTKTHKKITLSDKPGPQTVATGISDVKTVRLVLHSPVGLAPGRHLALAEVEFFKRG